MRNMWDFTTVIIVNLSVSLFCSSFLCTGYDGKNTVAEKAKECVLPARESCEIYLEIQSGLSGSPGDSEAWVILAILGFGLPVFMIPSSVDRDKSYAETYNRIFSSEWFLTIRPWMDKLLGGSLRLFVEGGKGSGGKMTITTVSGPP